MPYFLTAKKDLPQDGSNPTMLYGYGGFSVSISAAYRRTFRPGWSWAACG